MVEQGEIRAVPQGKTLHVNPIIDQDVVPHIQEWFEQYYSIRFRNYPVSDAYLHDAEIISGWQEAGKV
jgi:formylmethanofuran dehydrogenase subunit A